VNEVQNTEVEQPSVDIQPETKVLQQHEINAMVGGAKQKGFEKGYQQAKAELMSQKPNDAMQPNQPQNFTPTDNDSRLRQIALEELSKQRAIETANWEAKQREEAGTRILNELNTKASSAKAKFEDYDKVVRPGFSNFEKTPEVLLLAHQFDNSGEMLYDMAKNPGKIAQITIMAKLGMNDEAYSEMKKLSDSIKVNEMSANQPKPKMPLSQVNPSNVGVGKTDDNISSENFRGSY
jgi:hypothetical protein